MPRQKFAIAAVYDTETCNYGSGNTTIAYPILFIDNDIRDIDLYTYDGSRDRTNFYRHEEEYQERLIEYIKWGRICRVVPIVCAYNLMFDLQPIMQWLYENFDIRVNAQSSTNVYTLDLCEEDSEVILLRFWDTFHLEMRGLKAMGETCGMEKAVGDWDYSLVRTPETPLTDEELFYAKRDTQVIPKYLSYILHSNEWMKPDDLGVRILTKTSIVRQMARKNIAGKKITKQNGKKLTLDKAFTELCGKELPVSFESYGLRKACFRGGFTFTAASTAHTIVHNVVSLDVTSMHHTFINGRYIPQDFKPTNSVALEMACRQILDTTTQEVLEHYERPFKVAIHAGVRFRNLRLREGSCFADWGIALEASAKFKLDILDNLDGSENIRNDTQEVEVARSGWVDRYSRDSEFAFGKLYRAACCVIHVTELELWAISRVYEWDSFEVLYGELSSSWKRPPDFVTLQSNVLFDMKSKVKGLVRDYEKGSGFKGNLDGIPDGIAAEMRAGELDTQFLEAWYINTIKGMFNGIYGTQAQDIYKPNYHVVNGDLEVDESTKTTVDNWEGKQPSTNRVLYTYGMRIVGGSRVHMVLAMEMLYDYFGSRVRVTGGDTDSVKCACDDDVTDEELEKSLEPLAIASRNAIHNSMDRVRELFPKEASMLDGIGAFEIENRGAHYESHVEYWNKARISWDGRAHVTMAGMPRPIERYNIEDLINDLVASGYTFEEVVTKGIGFNTIVYNDICHILEGRHPRAFDCFERDVTDYLGNTSHVIAHESNALYPAPRALGETDKPVNFTSLLYMQRHYNRHVDTREKHVSHKGVYIDNGDDNEMILEVNESVQKATVLRLGKDDIV